MRPLAPLAIGVAAALAIACPACSKGSADEASPGAGAHLYEVQGCTLCHGREGQGGPLAPPLADLSASWTVESLAEYLRDPASVTKADKRLTALAERFAQPMPGYAAMSADDRKALARHLLERHP